MHSTPPLGSSRRNIAMPFDMENLPDGEKKFEDIFIRFDTIHERDGQKDRQTLHVY